MRHQQQIGKFPLALIVPCPATSPKDVHNIRHGNLPVQKVVYSHYWWGEVTEIQFQEIRKKNAPFVQKYDYPFHSLSPSL